MIKVYGGGSAMNRANEYGLHAYVNQLEIFLVDNRSYGENLCLVLLQNLSGWVPDV